MTQSRPASHQISVRRSTYDKLAKGLPRNARRVRPGALKERADRLINEALDREENKS